MTRGRWHSVLLYAVAAPSLALGATYWVHTAVDRLGAPLLPAFTSLDCCGCGRPINVALGLPASGTPVEVPTSHRDQYADWDRFLRGVDDEIKRRVPDGGSAREVLVVPYGTEQGWPFVSQERALMIRLYWASGPRGGSDRFFLGQDGADADRPLGMLCNWLCYLGLALPLTWGSQRLIQLVTRLLSGKRHGFPVIMLDEPR